MPLIPLSKQVTVPYRKGIKLACFIGTATSDLLKSRAAELYVRFLSYLLVFCMTMISMMVDNVDSFVSIKNAIRKLYAKSLCLVAPFVCKVYVDQNSLKSYSDHSLPHWCFMASGVLIVMYDPTTGRVLLCIYDESLSRIVWSYEVNAEVSLDGKTSEFFVINSLLRRHNTVGLLFYDRTIARRVFSLLKDLTSQMKLLLLNSVPLKSCPAAAGLIGECSGGDVGTSKRNGPKLFRSMSLRGMKKRNSVTEQVKEARCKSFVFSGDYDYDDPLNMLDCSNSSSNWSPSSSCLSKDVESVEAVFEKDLSNFGRVLRLAIEQHSLRKSTTLADANNGVEAGKSSKRQRLTRKLSQRLAMGLFRRHTVVESSPPDVSVSSCFSTLDLNPSSSNPRTISDSLLMKGSLVKFVLDSGSKTKDARERRYLLKALQQGNVQSTDLCTTDL